MRGYMSLAGADDAKQVPVEGRVGLYRIEERDQQVFAEVDGTVIPLGVSDVTVSRKKGDAPVVIAPRSEFMEIRNNGNRNPVTVDEQATDTVDEKVAEGTVATVKRDAVIEIGYKTQLKLVVEREAKHREVTNVNVESGEVVMGDKTERVSNVTQEDVVHKGSIDAGPPGEGDADSAGGSAGGSTSGEGAGAVDASARGETDEGGAKGDVGTDTQSYCEVHDRTYGGEHCPQCAAANGGEREVGDPEASDTAEGSGTGEATAAEVASGDAEASGDGGGTRTKYCMFCGDEIPAAAAHCPACGEALPD